MNKAAAVSPIMIQRVRQRRRQHFASAAALLILIAAWLVGRGGTDADLLPFVTAVLPQAERVERNGDLLIGYASADDGEDRVIGYAMAGSATGYGGPLMLLVGTNAEGNVVGVTFVTHRETPNFLRQLDRNDFYEQFDGVDYMQEMTIGDDIDGVSGATLSAEAVAQSIREAVRGIASAAIPGAVIPPESRPVKFGAPEITLIALFTVSFFLHRLKKRASLKRTGRWLVLIAGLIALGFIFNKPFTLANVITLLSGFWPDWHNNLYWFILIGGILLVTSLQGKNPYCSWFCPFGAAQEALASLTGAKIYQPRAIYGKLQWLQRGLAFSAIVLGLALRQPGAASYEPFGTLFSLQGTWPQWVLLVMVVFASLVVYRPFCNYLCPLDPVVDYIGELRHGVRNLWQKRKSLADSIFSRSA